MKKHGSKYSKKLADRSETMRRIKSRDTSLEKLFRLGLWRLGLRYRLGVQLPGKPDLVFNKHRIAIFVDSCFWHGCKEHCRMPNTRQEYWIPKITGNRDRDEKINLDLERMGWSVVRIWEHDLKDDFEGCLHLIRDLVRSGI